MLSDTLKSNCNSYNTVLNFFIIFFWTKICLFTGSQKEDRKRKSAQNPFVIFMRIS